MQRERTPVGVWRQFASVAGSLAVLLVSACVGDILPADPTAATGATTTQGPAPTASTSGVDPGPGTTEAATSEVEDDGASSESSEGSTTAAECVPESDTELCQAARADCDPLEALDRCGELRTVDCGECTAPDSCGGGGVANVCGCTPVSDAELCAADNYCEGWQLTDNCGQERVLDCGGCDFDESPVCSGGFCECSAPPAVTDLECQQNLVGVLNFSFEGQTESYSYHWSYAEANLPSCASDGTFVDGHVGSNTINIQPVPLSGECRYYRVCAHHPACDETYSWGIDMQVCEDFIFACGPA